MNTWNSIYKSQGPLRTNWNGIGQTAWYYVYPPGYYGGSLWQDQIRGASAILWNFANGFGWSTIRSPGGAGSIYFSSSGSNRVDFGNSSLFPGATSCTWAFSFQIASSTAGRILTQWGSATAQQCFDFEIVTGPLRLQVAFFGGTANYYIATTPTLTVGTWYRCVITFGGSPNGVKCWLNGRAQTLTPSSSNTFNSLSTSTSNIQLGFETAESLASANFYANDVSFYPSRVLTQSNVWTDFVLSQQGYPNIFKRQKRRALLLTIPPAPPTGMNPIAAYLRRSPVIGTGIF